MRPLKLGLFLPTFEGSEVEFYGLFPRTLRWPEVAALAHEAEAVGFDSLWVPDHLLLRWEGDPARTHGAWEAWSIVTALAAVTERVKIGTLVLCAAFRNPALLAKMADTVDEISGGRLILGLGAGWHEPEFDAFGFPFDHRASRFDEALTIISRLLRDGAVNFEGTYDSASACALRPRAMRPGGPPLMVAGGILPGPRMVRLAAERADLWNNFLIFGRSYPDVYPPLRDQIDAACAQIGRDPATLGRTVTVLVVPPGYEPGSLDPGVQPIVGTSDEIADVFRAYARLGVEHIQVVLHPCSEATVAALAPVLEALDRDGLPRPIGTG
jgi:probable F420-dependent oxidoreductase